MGDGRRTHGVTTALVGSVGSGSGYILSTQRHSDTMIRILLFSLVISLVLGLPQFYERDSAPALIARPAGTELHVVKRSPEEAGAEPEPEAGEGAEVEPEPESVPTD